MHCNRFGMSPLVTPRRCSSAARAGYGQSRTLSAIRGEFQRVRTGLGEPARPTAGSPMAPRAVPSSRRGPERVIFLCMDGGQSSRWTRSTPSPRLDRGAPANRSRSSTQPDPSSTQHPSARAQVPLPFPQCGARGIPVSDLVPPRRGRCEWTDRAMSARWSRTSRRTPALTISAHPQRTPGRPATGPGSQYGLVEASAGNCPASWS